MTEDGKQQIARDLDAAVNVTPTKLEHWLDSANGKRVGWKGADGAH